MKKSLYLFLIIGLGLLVSWIPSASAKKDGDEKVKDHDEKVVEVEEVTVTATRAEKEPFNTPNAITVINLT